MKKKINKLIKTTETAVRDTLWKEWKENNLFYEKNFQVYIYRLRQKIYFILQRMDECFQKKRIKSVLKFKVYFTIKTNKRPRTVLWSIRVFKLFLNNQSRF